MSSLGHGLAEPEFTAYHPHDTMSSSSPAVCECEPTVHLRSPLTYFGTSLGWFQKTLCSLQIPLVPQIGFLDDLLIK